MRDTPYKEAKELLSNPLVCEDIGTWVASKSNGAAFTVECGLLNNGVQVGLYVQLIHSYRPDLKVTKLKFSIFKRTAYGPERVFQLHVNDNPKASKNSHSMSHYHFGDTRIIVDQKLLPLAYDDALRYFCELTGVSFSPKPTIPTFELK